MDNKDNNISVVVAKPGDCTKFTKLKNTNAALQKAFQDERAKLDDTLNMLMSQWNIANSLKDETKREKHKKKIEEWIERTQIKMEVA